MPDAMIPQNTAPASAQIVEDVTLFVWTSDDDTTLLICADTKPNANLTLFETVIGIWQKLFIFYVFCTISGTISKLCILESKDIMKMEMVDQEEDDGQRMMKCVGRAISKHIYSSRANYDSPAALGAAERHEKFEEVDEKIEAGALKIKVDEELRFPPDVNAEINSERDKTVEVRVEVSNLGIEVDEAAIGRIQTLQEAVSHGLRQPQILDRLQQQVLPQSSSVVRWERFLPQHQLRVLLVEDDDATRHVVSALLRNCSYEVTSAENGLVAWEFLMDLNNHVDLVLTEVMMPCLSGIGLLSRIMSHEVLKHIPVIMMSSHDSMGVVFKCLSKGAVDFLVKPVRKNELKNLWQHVWRRCHSSSASGIGSGSGSHNQKVGQTNGVVDANNSSSNEEGNNTSSELNIGGGSDNGSGTQSSWIKKAPEVDSSNRAVDLELTEPNAGSNPQLMNNEHGIKESPVGQDVASSSPRETVAELTSLHLENGELGSIHRNLRKSANLSQDGAKLEGVKRANGRGISKGNSQMAMDLGSDEERQADSEDADYMLEKHASNSPSSKDKNMSDSSSPSLLELSLKRPRRFERNDGEEQGRVLLNHSHSSAFSRYNATGNHAPQPQDVCGPSIGSGNHVTEQGSCVGSSYPSATPFTLQTEKVAFSNSGSKEATTYFTNILQVNRNQESSIFRPSFAKEEGISGQLVSKSVLQMPPPGSFKDCNQSHYVHSPHKKTTASGEKLEIDDCVASYEHNQGHVNLSPNQKPQFHHHYRHHHHHHHIQHHYHHHYQEQNFISLQQEDQTVTNVATGAQGCGSSNVLKQGEGNNGQSGSSNGYGSNGNGAVSLNGSATGSNNPSNNLQNAGQVTTLPSGVNVDGDSRLQGGQDPNHSHGILPASDQCRSARREAALNKFRQKRKELCFEKKVRYQSRKKLAEQRPRVRGQFVKQSVYKATTGDPEQTAVTQTNNSLSTPKT